MANRVGARRAPNIYVQIGICIVLFAGLLRLLATLHWQDDLHSDPDGYLSLSEHLANGEGFINDDGSPTAFRPPGYPLLLAMVIKIGPLGIVGLHVGLGMLMTACTCFVSLRLVPRSSTEKCRLLAMVCAGLAVATDPLLLRYTPQLMTETLASCVTIGILAYGIVVRDRLVVGDGGKLRRVCLCLSLGVLIGTAVLVRPTYLAPFLLFSGASLILGMIRKRSEKAAGEDAGMKKFAWIAVLLCGVFVGMSPWIVRNAVVWQRFKGTTTHGGYTLLLGNNPVFYEEVVRNPHWRAWDGESLAAWQDHLEKELRVDGIDPKDEFARDRWMGDRAITVIRSSPRLFAEACMYRIVRFWDVRSLTSGVPSSVGYAVSTYYVVEFGFALIGFYWLWRSTSSWEDPSVLIAMICLIVGFTIVHAVYWTDTRMRAPVVPVIALASAYGFVAMLDLLRARGNG